MCLRTEKLYHAILFSRKPNITQFHDLSRAFKTPPTTELLAKLHAVKTGQTKPRQNPTGFPRVQGERQFNTIGFNASRICLGDQHPLLVPELYQGNPLDMPREQKETWFSEVSCRCSLKSTQQSPPWNDRDIWVAREDSSVAAHS